MALNEAGVKKFIDGHELKKTIIVPGRIVNLVVS
jgi:leucyl-tRNA synthetase